MPIRKPWAELINPYDYSCRLTGALPAKGFAGAMRPLWLGNRSGGVQVIAETDRTWQVKDGNRELVVLPRGDGVELRLHFVDHPVTISEPLTISFGYILTPVKPPPPRYRHWRVYTPRSAFWREGKLVNQGYHAAYEKVAMQAKRDIEVIDVWSTGWGAAHNRSGEVHYPMPKKTIGPERWRRPLYWGGAVWSFPYAQLHNFWAESPEFKQFGHEWVTNVDASYIPKPGVDTKSQAISVCQAARSYQDFVLHAFKRLFDQSNPRGFYFDVSRPIACNNVHHGCGYRASAADRPANTTNFLGTRRLVRRIYTLLKQRRPDGLIFFHMSGQIAMPIYSFCDAMVDGENFTSILDRKDNRGYQKVLDLDTFAAQYNTQHNMGPVSVFLPEFQRSGAIKEEEWAQFGTRPADYIFGLVLLHDGQIWWAYIHYDQLMKLFTVLDRAGWGDDYEFIPYWTQSIAKLPPGVVASFYKDTRKPRVLAVLMNFNDKPVALAARLDLASLGLTKQAGARDILHAGACDLGGGVLRLQAPAKTFRLVLLEE